MTDTPVNLSQALAAFTDVYSPRIVGRVNDYDIRIAHVRGEHVWHVHEHTDEFFLVLDGELLIDIEGADTIMLTRHQACSVPKGVVHRTRATRRTTIVMVEAAGVMPR